MEVEIFLGVKEWAFQIQLKILVYLFYKVNTLFQVLLILLRLTLDQLVSFFNHLILCDFYFFLFLLDHFCYFQDDFYHNHNFIFYNFIHSCRFLFIYFSLFADLNWTDHYPSLKILYTQEFFFYFKIYYCF